MNVLIIDMIGTIGSMLVGLIALSQCTRAARALTAAEPPQHAKAPRSVWKQDLFASQPPKWRPTKWYLSAPGYLILFALILRLSKWLPGLLNEEQVLPVLIFLHILGWFVLYALVRARPDIGTRRGRFFNTVGLMLCLPPIITWIWGVLSLVRGIQRDHFTKAKAIQQPAREPGPISQNVVEVSRAPELPDTRVRHRIGANTVVVSAHWQVVILVFVVLTGGAAIWIAWSNPMAQPSTLSGKALAQPTWDALGEPATPLRRAEMDSAVVMGKAEQDSIASMDEWRVAYQAWQQARGTAADSINGYLVAGRQLADARYMVGYRIRKLEETNEAAQLKSHRADSALADYRGAAEVANDPRFEEWVESWTASNSTKYQIMKLATPSRLRAKRDSS